MRPGRSGRKRGVEIHVEAPVEGEAIPGDPDHTNVMIPLEVNLAEVVFMSRS